MKPASLFRFASCRNGTAAAEMALVTPFLIVLMFGAFELGNYFLSEHVVVKAVRDGARYAARLNLTNYPCTAASPDNIPGGTVEQDTQNLVRTGQIDDGGTARLSGWTDGITTVTITYDCVASDSASPAYSGIYDGLDNVPVVTVAASVPYSSLFTDLGFESSTLSLNAEAQSVVMGI
ncbi:MAG TPA: TadE/TadG family type IV pilus assembly protein [Rhizorhapis sp.]|uniref:TadE/TadG family type IV pilus assembly protein n=1 Tax=Rhizorhapis sp. TaxID=1968842 RepID=UPI002B45E7C8|nr:TadE/TadG family type IV pilus assembly protein [Rhizorhapis sp.]HKR16228.1 TadE/TadG family type IV pilus assembly protein [Rhizorhapis sp.]HKX23149.1 TadE/TadG family type IV pilus assembly protein [Rhizorhapis sp.]